MEDHSFSQTYYTALIAWITAIPLWIDLLVFAVVTIGLYLAIHTFLPVIHNTVSPLLRSVWGSFKEFFSNNHHFTPLKKRYPRLFSFIHARLDTSHFLGLAMTLFFLLFLYLIALFGGLVEDVMTHDDIVDIDHYIALWSMKMRTDFFNHFFWAITQMGRLWVISFFTLLFSLFLWFSHRRYYLLGLYVSLLGSVTLAFVGKYAFARERPSGALYHEALYSFPSGHATIAVAFFGFVLYTFFQETSTFRTKLNLFFIAFILIFLIGISRIYFGVHYVSDIWAGYLIGSMWMVIGVALSEYQRSHTSCRKLSVRESHHLALILSLAAFICYLLFLYWHPLLQNHR